jgi:hypothetical protein
LLKFSSSMVTCSGRNKSSDSVLHRPLTRVLTSLNHDPGSLFLAPHPLSLSLSLSLSPWLTLSL